MSNLLFIIQSPINKPMSQSLQNLIFFLFNKKTPKIAILFGMIFLNSFLVEIQLLIRESHDHDFFWAKNKFQLDKSHLCAQTRYCTSKRTMWNELLSQEVFFLTVCSQMTYCIRVFVMLVSFIRTIRKYICIFQGFDHSKCGNWALQWVY